jgi:hypothetical protein
VAAAKHDILIEQGATFRLNLVWKDSVGTPVNLTGYSARMQVRRSLNTPTPLLDLTTANGAITLGGINGTIAVIASATLTDDLTARFAVYDLELQSADGTVTRLIEGKATISPEVTR